MDTNTADWQKLKEAWQRLPGDPSIKRSLFVEIQSKYSVRTRHYHNGEHLLGLLQLSEQYPLQDKEVVQFAIFYHDIIYRVVRKDNETRSADLAVKRLRYLQVEEAKIERIWKFIVATQTHQVGGEPDLELFLDFDMSILGAPWLQYLIYTQQIRKEYRIYPTPLYKAGRKKFLQQCLQTPHIFHSAAFRKRLEAQARQNIQQELALYDEL